MSVVLLFLTAKTGPDPAKVAAVNSAKVIATMAKTAHFPFKVVITSKNMQCY
ncbi:MAG: hypothetical protein WCF23_02840 [Candidatus Nitrosopolaris sp.]